MAGVWRKTLVYLGLAEEEEYDDYEEPEAEEPRGRLRPMEEADRPAPRRDAVVRAMPTPASPRVHLVQPTAFNDAQEVGDKYREGSCVLMNLQSADSDLARRLVDFASGLAYGLAGSMQPVADRVFLITPSGVSVSAEDRKRFLEERGFFNQA